MKQLVLIRHGESIWNAERRFSGWADIPLTELGCEQARIAGRTLAKNGFEFDIAYTSLLKRSIKTLNILLEEMDLLWIPVVKSWRINERQDGALQGMSGDEIRLVYGEDNVIKWVSDFKDHPPQISMDDFDRHPIHDKKYKEIDPALLSGGENFGETLARVGSYFEEAIVPQIKSDKRVIVCAHNHVMRCLSIILGTYTPDDYYNISIPNSVPLVYEFDSEMNVVNSYYLKD